MERRKTQNDKGVIIIDDMGIGTLVCGNDPFCGHLCVMELLDMAIYGMNGNLCLDEY